MNSRAWSSLPELKNSQSFSYFLKPKPKKKPDPKIAKTQTRKKPINWTSTKFNSELSKFWNDVFWPNFGQNFLSNQ